jgi:hypothetical protein
MYVCMYVCACCVVYFLFAGILPMKKSLSHEVIEEGEEDEEEDYEDSGSESQTGRIFSDDDEDSIGEGGAIVGMSMRELQEEVAHAKQQSLKLLSGSSAATHGERVGEWSRKKSLLDQFSDHAMEVKNREGKDQEEGGRSDSVQIRGTMKGVRASKLLRLGETLLQAKARQKTEAARAPRAELRMHPKTAAAKMLTALINVYQRVWLRSRHLAIMLKWYSAGAIVRLPDFGSYRVELVVMLFARVLDVHNFDLVLEQLMPQEIACVYCRLGMLSVFNPLKVEGCYCLDVSRYEERVVAKIMAILSTIEPGENWINETFRWE